MLLPVDVHFRLAKQRLAGLLHVLVLTAIANMTWIFFHNILHQVYSPLAFIWDVYVCYSLFCFRDLIDHSRVVLHNLGDIEVARKMLGRLVGRDTDLLQRDGIVRATIESLAENFVDGILTPLCCFVVAGIPGLITFKVISTLDSMIGYKNQRYIYYGWAAARLDDVANWVPARVSVYIIFSSAWILAYHPQLVFRAAKQYRKSLPSPNSGLSEASYAGALKVRLLGPIYRKGVLTQDVFMGDDSWDKDLQVCHLRRAIYLTITCTSLSLVLCVICLWLRGISLSH